MSHHQGVGEIPGGNGGTKGFLAGRGAGGTLTAIAAGAAASTAATTAAATTAAATIAGREAAAATAAKGITIATTERRETLGDGTSSGGKSHRGVALPGRPYWLAGERNEQEENKEEEGG